MKKLQINEHIRGHLIKDDDKVYGVAFDKISSLPVVVKLIVNGTEIERQIANRKRKQIKNLYEVKSKFCGYKFVYAKNENDKIKVFAGVSNTLLRNQNKKNINREY